MPLSLPWAGVVIVSICWLTRGAAVVAAARCPAGTTQAATALAIHVGATLPSRYAAAFRSTLAGGR